MSDEAGVQRALIPISVLVVEDEESTRKLCADLAESCGMKAILAGSVEEALRRLENSAVDIIITDLILPPSNPGPFQPLPLLLGLLSTRRPFFRLARYE